MSHSCFIYSSTDEDSGCFHILAIVNNTAMNLWVIMFFWISVLGSFGYISEVGSLGQKTCTFYVSWGISILFSTVSAPDYIPNNSAKWLPFLYILVSTCCLLIHWWPFWHVLDDISLWFQFAFLWWLVTLRTFSYVCWPSVCPLWRIVYLGPSCTF